MNSSTKCKALLLSLALFLSSAQASWITQTAKYAVGGVKAVATNGTGAKAAKTINPGSGSVISKAPSSLIIQALIALGLSATDYVLDPANNAVIVKNVGRYCNGEYNICVETLAEARVQTIHIISRNNHGYRSLSCTQNGSKGAMYCTYEWERVEPGRQGTIPFYPNGTIDKQVSYDTVAGAIDTLAQAGNAQAQDTIERAVADEINAGVHDRVLDATQTMTESELDAIIDDAKANAQSKDKTKEKEATKDKEQEAEGQKPFEMPDFCKWAKFICDDDIDKDTDVDVSADLSGNRSDTTIRFGGHCPNDTLVSGHMFGKQLSFTLFEWSKFCGWLALLKPIIIAMASYAAVKIVGGVNVAE